jgi:hypothetical protein
MIAVLAVDLAEPIRLRLDTFRRRNRMTRTGRLAAISLCFLAACGSDCVEKTTQYNFSVSTVGYVGATLGLPVARFDLTQNFITHEPYEACAQGPLVDIGVVDLKITSLASTPLFIKYDVQGLNASGTPVWSHADTIGVVIAPSQSISVAHIASTAQPLGSGSARVLLQAAEIVQ